MSDEQPIELFAIVLLHNSSLHQYFPSKLSIGILLTSSAFIFGSLTWKFEKPVLILATSFLGCYALLCGVDIFTRSDFSIAVFAILLYLRDAFVASIKHMHHSEIPSMPELQINSKHNDTRTILMTSWVFISFGAAYFQYRVTATSQSQGGEMCPCIKCFLPCCGNSSTKEKDLK